MIKDKPPIVPSTATATRTLLVLSSATKKPPTATQRPTSTKIPTPTEFALPTMMSTLPFFIMSDNFSSNKNGWPTGYQGDPLGGINFVIANGQYTWEITAKDYNLLVAGPDNSPDLTDFSVAVDAQMISGPADSDFGLIFRYDQDQFYLFVISDQTQVYKFALCRINNSRVIIDWTHSNAIRTGEVNHILVVGLGSQFTFYINGQFVAQASDETFTNGNIGMATELFNAGDNATFQFDNFELRKP